MGLDLNNRARGLEQGQAVALRSVFALSSPAEQYKITSEVITKLRIWFAEYGEKISPQLLAESSAMLGSKVRLSVKECEGTKYLMLGYSVGTPHAFVEMPLAPKHAYFQEHSLANSLGMLLLDGVQVSKVNLPPALLSSFKAIFSGFELEPSSLVNKIIHSPVASKSRVRSWGESVALLQPRAEIIDAVCLDRLSEILNKYLEGAYLKPDRDGFRGKGIFFIKPLVGTANFLIRTEDASVMEILEKNFSQRVLPVLSESDIAQKSFDLRSEQVTSLLRDLTKACPYLIEEKLDFLNYERSGTGLPQGLGIKGEMRFIYCWDDTRSRFGLQAGCCYESLGVSTQKYSATFGRRSIAELIENIVEAAQKQGLSCSDPKTLLSDLILRVDVCAQEFMRRTTVPEGHSAAPIAIDVAPVVYGNRVDFALVEINQASLALKIGAKKIQGAAALRLVFSEWKPYFCLPEISSLMDHDY